jgi:hypothetical protein
VSAARADGRVIPEVEDDDLSPQNLAWLREVVFVEHGVPADEAAVVVPAYFGIVDELIGYADTVLSAAPAERAHLIASGFDFDALERDRAALKAHSASRVDPPNQNLLRATTRRLKGASPGPRSAVQVEADADLAARAGDSPTIAKIRQAIAAAQAVFGV